MSEPQDKETRTDAQGAWGQSHMRPTLNGTGFMFEVLDEFADDFIQFSASAPAPVLEVGCAFGVASLPALASGASVVACDLDQGHLDILNESAPEDQRARLECVQGQLPGVDFGDERFSAVLCSRVLHFLDGAAVDASVRNMYRWLKPGGRLYLVADIDRPLDELAVVLEAEVDLEQRLGPPRKPAHA